MDQKLALVTIVVRDYDEAISYYTEKLGFQLQEDFELPDAKRWVVVKPRGKGGASILLALANGQDQELSIGNQTGGRVFLFLNTDDFLRDYQKMRDAGIIFREEPRFEAYGTVAVFEDIYGNLWDLLEPKTD